MQQLFCATVIFLVRISTHFYVLLVPKSPLQKRIFDFQILHYFSFAAFSALFVEFMKKNVGFFRMRGVCPPLFSSVVFPQFAVMLSPPRLWGVNFFSTRGWGSLVTVDG